MRLGPAERFKWYGRGWRYIFLGCIGLLATACGGGGGGEIQPTDPNAIELASDVVPADLDTQARLVTATEEGALHFSAATSQTDALQPGEILLIGITEATPEGFFGRVIRQEVEEGGVGVVVYTEPVPLSEIISKGVLEYKHTFTADDVQSVELASGVSFAATGAESSGNLLKAGQTSEGDGFHFTLGDSTAPSPLGATDPMDRIGPVLVHDADGEISTTDDQVWVVGDLTFRDVEMDFRFGPGLPAPVILEVKQRISSSVRLYGSYSDHLEIPRVHIATISFTDVEVGGGGGRFVLGPYLAVYIEVNGEINLDFSAEVAMEAPDVTAKAVFAVGVPPVVTGSMGSPSLDLVEFRVAGSASAQSWAYGEAGVKIAALGFSAVDVSLRAGPFVEAGAELDRGVVDWAIYGGAKGDIGAIVAGFPLGRMGWIPYRTLVAGGEIVIYSRATLAFSKEGEYDFGRVEVGETADHRFKITKGGDMFALKVVGGGLSAPFSFTGGSFPGDGGTCGKTIYNDCTVSIRFAPTSVGDMGGTLVLSYDDGHGRAMSISKRLAGTGAITVPATLSISQGDHYDFGSVEIGATRSHVFQVRKGGDLDATGVRGSGLSSPFQFKGGLYPGAGGTCGLTITGDCTIVASFTPEKAGSSNDRIEMTYFDGRNSQVAWGNVLGTGAHQPLVVTVADPTSGQVISGDHTLLASTSGGAGASGLVFYVGEQIACYGQGSNGSWSCKWDSTRVGNGSYDLTAVASDANATRTTSSRVGIEVQNQVAEKDNTPPTVSVTDPLGNQSITGSYRFMADATDDVEVASVAFFVDGSAACTGLIGAGGWSCYWNSAVVTDGPHEIVARARDSSGNQAMSLAVPFEVNNGAGSGEMDWQLETVDGLGKYRTDVGRYSGLATSPDGTIHISYLSSSTRGLKHAWMPAGGEWSAETVDSADGAGSHSSIALAADGTVHIAYYNVKDRNLNHAWGTAGSWQTEVVDSTYGGGLGKFTSIAVAPDGAVHISYHDSAIGNLKHASKRPGGRWSSEEVDSTGNVGLYTGIAFASDGAPHISYYDTTNGNLKHAWRPSGETWSSEPVDSAGDVGYWTSMAVASDGTLHVSYLGTTGGLLKHAWKPPGGPWSTEGVDSIGYIGEGAWGINTSITIASDGTLHISYAEGGGDHPPDAKNNLKHAWQSPGAKWSVETVDSGSVGLYASIDIASTGIIYISHYDVTNGDLILAWAKP